MWSGRAGQAAEAEALGTGSEHCASWQWAECKTLGLESGYISVCPLRRWSRSGMLRRSRSHPIGEMMTCTRGEDVGEERAGGMTQFTPRLALSLMCLIHKGLRPLLHTILPLPRGNRQLRSGDHYVGPPDIDNTPPCCGTLCFAHSRDF